MDTLQPHRSYRLVKAIAAAVIALGPAVSFAQPLLPPPEAQYAPPSWQGAAYGRRQLDQMLAPVALYPDTLLAQILVASTYPEQVADAARWSQANPGLQGDYAMQAAQGRGWDASVQSLAAFPQVLAQMAANYDWMRSLGEAFLSQERQVMDSVQDLRQRANEAGTLRSDEQILVERDGPLLTIVPAQPLLTYVPYYDPLVAYGAWPWAAYPPVYWRPWAGYRVRPGWRGFAWGPAVAFRARPLYGGFDWHHQRVHSISAGSRFYERRLAETPIRREGPRLDSAPAFANRDIHRPMRQETQAARIAPQAPRFAPHPAAHPFPQTVTTPAQATPHFSAPHKTEHPWRAQQPAARAAQPAAPAPAAQHRGHGNPSQRGDNGHGRGEGRRRS